MDGLGAVQLLKLVEVVNFGFKINARRIIGDGRHTVNRNQIKTPNSETRIVLSYFTRRRLNF